LLRGSWNRLSPGRIVRDLFRSDGAVPDPAGGGTPDPFKAGGGTSSAGDARALANWEYGACRLDLEPDRFGPFADLLVLWGDRYRRRSALPHRGDFDFFDFQGWWGRISILKIEREPFDGRFVLWGTQLVNWWGVDYTNKLLGSQSITPEVWQAVESKYLRAMSDDPFIGLVCGRLDQHRRPFIKVLGVDLPLSDGERLSHVLSGYIEVDQDVTVATGLPDCEILRYY